MILRFLRHHAVALVALGVALGGTSYAAAKLPPNSVTSLQVKDRSLRSVDFAVDQLPAGPQGPRGDRGPAGFSDVYRSTFADVDVDRSPETVAMHGGLPAGSYLIVARFVAETAFPVDCSLVADADEDRIEVPSNGGGARGVPTTLMLAHVFPADDGTVELTCRAAVSAYWIRDVQITAVRVNAVHA